VKEKWAEAKAVNDQAQAQYNTPMVNQPMYMGFGGVPGQGQVPGMMGVSLFQAEIIIHW
jgi:hypothetical protein